MDKIKLIILDVDGTLTDGRIAYDNNGTELKPFNIKDGLILRACSLLGINVVFMTGRTAESVAIRANELGAEALQGIEKKEIELEKLLAKYDVAFEQCAFIGDDLNDYTAMQLCAFKACPADAVPEIREICDFVSSKNGGYGAVRDICEHLLRKQGQYEDFLTLFGV
ncbi:MAG: HAD hydrolase family protein [Defluviitaleaceae bacterium]|nr:HAD hydrolase family protein [Defluviitaleaceae bacterium]MCL2276172.1 HAD hydrolase family protein [Defluviitaleaceae bacterium]